MGVQVTIRIRHVTTRNHRNILVGFLHPVFGVQMMASSTMYGNVKNYGGGNHLLVPTGLLQTWLAPVGLLPTAWLFDFGGGWVRVEHTNSTALMTLSEAEVTLDVELNTIPYLIPIVQPNDQTL